MHNYGINLRSHQMQGGPMATKPRQGQMSDKEQEKSRARYANHAEPVKVPVYKIEGRGNKIC